MLGAIIGDICGSRWEFHNFHNKSVPLFTDKNFFTDDTVMTCAIADALINNKTATETMREYGNKWIDMSYGRAFLKWLTSEKPEPYNSYGNGAAMRVSPCAYMANSEKELKKLVKKVTKVTHNHPEGLKGAEVVAMCVFKALNGATKEEIKKYAISQYPEIANFDYYWLNRNYRYSESCQRCVPQAIFCFLISTDFSDCIKTTISIGGDSDTLCAMSGAIAEAYYGIPEEIKEEALKYFRGKEKKALLEPIIKIYEKCGKFDYIRL